MKMPCASRAPNAAISFALIGCGAELEGSSNTFAWTDPQMGSAGYDFWLGSSPGARDIYDNDGNVNDISGGTVFVSGIPTDGRTLHGTVYRLIGGLVDAQASCTYTAAPQSKTTDSTTADFGPDVAYGSVSEAMLDSWFILPDGTPLNWGLETSANMAVDDGCLKIKYDPVTSNGSVGSSRTIANARIPDAEEYVLEFDLIIPPGFDFARTIKLGFGLGAGTNPTGGANGTPCGNTIRFISRTPDTSNLQRAELRAYSYASDIPGPYGLDIPTGFFMEAGNTYRLAMRVKSNTFGNSDGVLELWADGKYLVGTNTIRWMDHTQCAEKANNFFDTLWISSFYGGTNRPGDKWNPASRTELSYCNFSLRAA